MSRQTDLIDLSASMSNHIMHRAHVTRQQRQLSDYATRDLDSLAYFARTQPTRREQMCRAASWTLITSIIFLGLMAAIGAIG